jgi:hypothetical protein
MTYLITALHGRYFTVLHGWYRNVYYSTYLYYFSFKPTNTLFGRITPGYNMPPTWCGPYQGVPDKGRSYKDTIMQISQNQLCIYFLPWCNSPNGPRPPHYQEIMITLRHISLSWTPLDEWSAQCTDLCLTTYNTHKRQTSLPPAGFTPAIPARE